MTEYNDGRLPPVPHQQIDEWIGAGWGVWEETPTFTGCNKLSRVYILSKGGERSGSIWDGWTMRYIDFDVFRNLFNNLGV
jgi:hypothetical protein